MPPFPNIVEYLIHTTDIKCNQLRWGDATPEGRVMSVYDVIRIVSKVSLEDATAIWNTDDMLEIQAKSFKMQFVPNLGDVTPVGTTNVIELLVWGLPGAPAEAFRREWQANRPDISAITTPAVMEPVPAEASANDGQPNPTRREWW